MTFFAAGLVGAGVAAVGVTAAVVGRRLARIRRQLSGASVRPVPIPRPTTGRPGGVPVRPGPQPRAKDPRSRASGALAPGGPKGPYRPPPHLPEALEGETLQLHAVPAWKLPIRSRTGGVAAGSGAGNGAGSPGHNSVTTAADAASTPATGGPVPLLARRRGEYASTAARSAGEEPDVTAEEARVNRDPREAWDGRPGTSVVTNASRRHDPRTAPGRASGR